MIRSDHRPPTKNKWEKKFLRDFAFTRLVILNVTSISGREVKHGAFTSKTR